MSVRTLAYPEKVGVFRPTLTGYALTERSGLTGRIKVSGTWLRHSQENYKESYKMISAHILAISILWTVLASPLACAGDLSSYREFQFGMNLPVAVKLVSMNSSEARVIHQRPALIQELDWRPGRYPGSSPDTDAVKDSMFSFCNGELLGMRIPGLRYPEFRLRRSDRNGAGEWRGRTDSVFQGVSVSFAEYDLVQLTRRADAVREEYLDLISSDQRWLDAVGSRTGKWANIEYTFETWKPRLRACMSGSEPLPNGPIN
jgi:hypothetical protein